MESQKSAGATPYVRRSHYDSVCVCGLAADSCGLELQACVVTFCLSNAPPALGPVSALWTNIHPRATPPQLYSFMCHFSPSSPHIVEKDGSKEKAGGLWGHGRQLKYYCYVMNLSPTPWQIRLLVHKRCSACTDWLCLCRRSRNQGKRDGESFIFWRRERRMKCLYLCT